MNDAIRRNLSQPSRDYRLIRNDFEIHLISSFNLSEPSMHLRVFLDDVRPTPEGWTRTYWPDEVISLLKTGLVCELSLDHDLGDDLRGTGYDVIVWIEEAVAIQRFVPPLISVHSANLPARQKMMAGIRSIEDQHQRNLLK